MTPQDTVSHRKLVNKQVRRGEPSEIPSKWYAERIGDSSRQRERQAFPSLLPELSFRIDESKRLIKRWAPCRPISRHGTSTSARWFFRGDMDLCLTREGGTYRRMRRYCKSSVGSKCSTSIFYLGYPARKVCKGIACETKR